MAEEIRSNQAPLPTRLARPLGGKKTASQRGGSVSEQGPEAVSRRGIDHALIWVRSRRGRLSKSHLVVAGWRCAAAGWLGGISRDRPNSFSRKVPGR